MSATVDGRVNWTGDQDVDGHRDYEITFLVYTSDVADGPQQAFNAAGLASVGDQWTYGNDGDAWAFCTPEATVKPLVPKEDNDLWLVTQNFTTRPTDRCQDNAIENPLDEPPRLRGSFNNYEVEGFIDKDNNWIHNSSRQFITGDQAKWDGNRPVVEVELTHLILPLATFAPMINKVNDSTMWGLPARTIKLSNASWQRLIYGTCNYYYTVNYVFDIQYDTFDKTIPDFGSKVYIGGAGGDQDDPAQYEWIKDGADDRKELEPLDGNGGLWDGTGVVPQQTIQFYQEDNLLSLGVPSSL